MCHRHKHMFPKISYFIFYALFVKDNNAHQTGKPTNWQPRVSKSIALEKTNEACSTGNNSFKGIYMCLGPNILNIETKYRYMFEL